MKVIRRLPPAVRHLLLVTLFGLPLTTSLWRWTAVPCTHDGHLHYHRLAAMRYAWENGLYFTRWLPDLAFGYGYPFFVYREPAPLYLGLIPHLFGLALPAATNLLYILCILASGWFMYLWARDILGSRAGFIAAIAYMAAPYVLIDALIRGNLPESLALPLFPFLLWSGRRWVITGRVIPFLLSTLGLAGLALSHNISLLLFTPALLVYLLAIGRLHRLAWRLLAGRLFLLFALGLGATFFYTGGALLEMDAVTLSQSTSTRNNDFHFNFAGLEEIFAPVSPEDPALINPPLPFRLGWAPVLLALLGLIALVRVKEREQRWHIGLMALGTAVFLLMSLPISLPLWEGLPLIEFIQFPWRFVGRAALPIAFLAGVPFAHPTPPTSRITYYVLRITYYLAPILLLLEALPLLYPTICFEEPFPTINAVHTYEHSSGLVGVDPEGSYFPQTVRKRPDASPLEADYLANETPQRFDMSVLPAGTTVAQVEYGRLSTTVHLNTPEPFTARYLTFAFPGWEATIDGQAVPVTPDNPEGLITFPVPAGEHMVAVRWRSTPLRTALLGLSITALAGIVVTAVFLISRRPARAGNQSLMIREGASQSAYRSLNTDYLLLALALIILAFKLFLVDKSDTIFRRVAPPPVGQAAALQAGELQLAGYNVSQERVVAGATFDVDMAWMALAPPTADYQSNVWLIGPEGLLWSEKGTERPRLYEDAPRTRFWLPGQWAWDSREVRVLPGTPPGQYDIEMTLFDLATLQPLTLIDTTSGSVVGPTAVIGQIAVEAPARPPTFTPQFFIQEEVPGMGLELLGYNQDRAEAAPGEQLLLTFFWERKSSLAAELFTLQLLNEAGQVKQSWQLPVKRADFATVEWPIGQRLRSQHLLPLSPHLDSGVYHFRLQQALPLGQLAVNAPQRFFTEPEFANTVRANFSNDKDVPQVALTGYTLEPSTSSPGGGDFPSSLTLTLVWQGVSELSIGYHVFVHLVDEAGQIVAQSDGVPAGWMRPTTGWIPGEYIVDQHQLSLPAELPEGPLALHIGMYDVDSGARLKTATADFVTLPFTHP